MTPESHDVGRAMARALGTGPSRSTLQAQRESVVSAMIAASRPRIHPLAATALAFGVFALAALFVRFWSSPGELSAKVAGVPLAPHARLVASQSEQVEFSDGSRIALEPEARIEISRLSSERADIVLDDGRLAASIRKGTGRAWTISAGPFDVRVVGTEFSVLWERDQQAFAVSVREGKVLVFGKDLPAAGVPLEAGGRFERRLEPLPSRSVEPPPAAPAPSVGEAPPSDPPRDPAPARVPSEPDWTKLAREAQYARALELAERSGFERLTRELAENDLLLLANTARYAGDARKARMALQKLRSRFPRGAAAPVSALYLARIAEDHDKNPVEAAHWLNVFLNESPRGGLAADARARLLSLLLKQGNRQRAREVAADYLKYHPDGPHAAKARGLVGSAD
jgi:hypothetical protein